MPGIVGIIGTAPGLAPSMAPPVGITGMVGEPAINGPDDNITQILTEEVL